ncbi:ABC transporter ATP-binding protein [Rhizomonospora bruguierae]|uniref:ABC transporter ATP-binding protein n=1 Tax=Rhizomonospora bruguierae TaxID=1581705 RepID=UPI001BD0B8C3|nr:ABC transporter ATP-binding protein [Micromonospora sp. NBRC 107566]
MASGTPVEAELVQAELVQARGLTKRYGDRTALDGASFAVREGEIFGILGPNGAGKTTAVECVAGLRRPDSGEVRVLGRDPRRGGRELRERVGVQLQQAKLPDAIKVGEALRLYASFYRRPRDWRELLDDLGLADHVGARFGRLSGGQKQRVNVALALVGDPRLAILDELTTGLDPHARRETWDAVARIRDRGVTVILVSHFMDEVERLCDRLAVFDRGRVVAVDTPAGLIDRVDAAYRLSFRPMDGTFSDGPLRDLAGVARVEREGGRVVVTGRGRFADEVTAALARRRLLVADLRIEPRTLDGAFVALTGNGGTGRDGNGTDRMGGDR